MRRRREANLDIITTSLLLLSSKTSMRPPVSDNSLETGGFIDVFANNELRKYKYDRVDWATY